MGLFAKFSQATPETVASRYFGSRFYGTEEQKQELAGQVVEFEPVSNKGRTSAENLKIKR